MTLTVSSSYDVIRSSFFFVVLLASSSGEPLRWKSGGKSEDQPSVSYTRSECDYTALTCVSECDDWAPDGDFQWCGGCGQFVRCSRGNFQLLPCSSDAPIWDDLRKECQKTSDTCFCWKKNNDDETTTTKTRKTTHHHHHHSTGTTSEPVPSGTESPKPTTNEKPESTTTETLRPTTSKTPHHTKTPHYTITPHSITSKTLQSTVFETQQPTVSEILETTVTIETPQPTETEAPQPTETEAPQPTETEAPQPTETEAPQPTETEAPQPTETEAPQPTATETPQPTVNETLQSTVSQTSHPTGSETQKPTVTETPHSVASETPIPTATETLLPNVTETLQPTATQTLPNVTETLQPTFPNVTETLQPNATQTFPNVTETLQPNATQTLPNVTETNPPTTTLLTETTTLTTTAAPTTTTMNPADKDHYIEGSVYMNPINGKITYRLGVMDRNRSSAYGFFNHTIHRTGWGVLEIRLNTWPRGGRRFPPPFGNWSKLYAAGFLEGLLTARQIWDNYVNLRSQLLPRDPRLLAAVKKFLKEQNYWMRDMVRLNQRRADPYWENVRHILSQMDGLYDGYRVIAKKEKWGKDFSIIQLLNANADLGDIIRAVAPSYARRHASRFTAPDYGRCSALIKLTPGFEDVFIGHSTWYLYQNTLRIYKHYVFDIFDRTASSFITSFSGYPGVLSSTDDFYVLDSQLVVMETTNSIYNDSLFAFVTPESLLTWQRTILANRMASSGEQWFNFFRLFNSGTYNNQFMVLDLKKIIPGKSVEDGALWIIEQIPGYVEGADQTEILRAGYWPSYNIPFYENIFQMSGYTSRVDIMGPDESYSLAPRAKIFRREVGKVTNITTFRDLLRHNDYKNDEYSRGDPMNAICSRGDLKWPESIGCYDTKVTNFQMALNQTSHVISGPTTSHGLKPFAWTGVFAKQPHIGLPDVYNFDWVTMAPSLISSDKVRLT